MITAMMKSEQNSLSDPNSRRQTGSFTQACAFRYGTINATHEAKETWIMRLVLPSESCCKPRYQALTPAWKTYNQKRGPTWLHPTHPYSGETQLIQHVLQLGDGLPQGLHLLV